MYVCMYVCVRSVLWLRAPMDKWLDSLSESDTRVRIPLNVPSFFFSSYHILHLQFIGLYIHMRSQTSDVGCRSGCKETV